MNKYLLSIRDLSVSFEIDGKYYPAVDGVSLDVGAGEVLGVVGESGSGKTALAMSITRLHTKARTTGQVMVGGRDVITIGQRELEQLRGRKVAMVFQDPGRALNPVMRVGSQIAEAISTGNPRERAKDLLEEVGLARDIYDKFPHELSGGMRQRVVIAAALAGSPELLVADEPTTALDVSVQAQILELLKELVRSRGMSVLLVTHDMGVVAEVAHKVAVMYAGQIVELAPVEILFNKPLHPYTCALLSSLYSLSFPEERLPCVAGGAPSLEDMSRRGCRFASRMNIKGEHEDEPLLREVANGHFVRCVCYAKG